ncbi:MAG: hypothetical protein ACAI43_19155, partial [Phycisphaerae bacterium]
IYRADDRAISSVNREIFAQQQSLAGKIRQLRPQIVLAPLPGDADADADPDVVPLTEEEMRQARGAAEG